MLQPLIVAFAVIVIISVLGGFVVRLWRDRGTPTQPLRAIAGVFGRYLLLYAAFAAFTAWSGYFGGGPRGGFCVDTGFPASGSGHLGVTARPGAELTGTGTVRACALHPGGGQWALYLLARLPGVLLWACILLLVWRLIRTAERSGPFAPQVCAVIRQLGWVVIGGTMVAAACRQLGTDELTGMLLTPRIYDGPSVLVSALITGPLRALLPVAAITGAGLLSFARILRLGTAMAAEIKATV